MTKSTWIFIVDTDSYSGNFAQKMAVYMVGNHCNDYPDESEKFAKEFPEMEEAFGGLLTYRYNEYGEIQSDLWLTPFTEKYESVAIFFGEKPSNEMLEFLVSRTNSFQHPGVKVLGCRLVREETIEHPVQGWSNGE